MYARAEIWSSTFSLGHETEGIKLKQNFWGGTISLPYPSRWNEGNLNGFPNVSGLPNFEKEATEKNTHVEKYNLSDLSFFVYQGRPSGSRISSGASKCWGDGCHCAGNGTAHCWTHLTAAEVLIPVFSPSSAHLHHQSKSISSSPGNMNLKGEVPDCSAKNRPKTEQTQKEHGEMAAFSNFYWCCH